MDKKFLKSNPDKEIKKLSNAKAFTLPVSHTIVYQPNRITNATFHGFGLIHTRIFIAIIKSLQEAVRAEMNGLNWEQMKLFEEHSLDSIQVKISLKDVTTANHYPEALKAARELMALEIRLHKGNTNNGEVSFRTLFFGVDAPEKMDGKTILKIHVLKAVAREIISIAKNKEGKVIRFTKFVYEIAMSSASKYTARIYILISSWKNKGTFYISMEDIRRILDVRGTEYKNFSSFKKRVLLPAQKELENKADCWFDALAEGFENKAGKKVIGLNFKVITKLTGEKEKERMEHLRYLLRSHGGFVESDFTNLSTVFSQVEKMDDILVRVVMLLGKRVDANGIKIGNKVAYIKSALIKEFVPV